MGRLLLGAAVKINLAHHCVVLADVCAFLHCVVKLLPSVAPAPEENKNKNENKSRSHTIKRRALFVAMRTSRITPAHGCADDVCPLARCQ